MNTMKTFYNYFFEGIKPEISAEDLMAKHNVSKQRIQKALEDGIKIEMEHTDDENTARTIASHHINELLDYYDRLKKVEK